LIPLAIASAVILALVAIPTTIIEAALRRTADKQELAESWGFFRLVVFTLFALVIGQVLAPVGYLWWINVLVAILVTVVVILSTQLLSKWLAHRPVGAALIKALHPVIRRVNLLFTPLSGPAVEEPEEFEQELMDSVEEFTETIAREIMVPRIDMISIDGDATLAMAMKVFLSRGYSRLPVLGKSIDDVLGVIYLKDVARVGFENPGKLDTQLCQNLMRKAIFVPEFKPVDDLLREMQVSSTHIAIVIDEYGGVAGLVTMEDVIEEIVGEISDEYDREVPEVEQLTETSYLVNARYSLFDLGELFDLELEDEDVDTVGGLLAKELGRLPKQGESVQVSGLILTADRIEPRRKRLVTVVVEQTQALAGAEAALEENNEL